MLVELRYSTERLSVQFDAIVHVELRSTYVNVDNEEVGNNRVVMLDGDNNGGGMDEGSD